jgi:hypothetical protein
MKDLHGPQTQVVEGAYAIKVSMSCSDVLRLFLYWTQCARTIYLIMIICHMNQRLANRVIFPTFFWANLPSGPFLLDEASNPPCICVFVFWLHFQQI